LVDGIGKTAEKALGITLPIATITIRATMARVVGDIMAVYPLYNLDVALRIVLFLLAFCVVGVGLFAVLPLLLRSGRRSPIADMRDE